MEHGNEEKKKRITWKEEKSKTDRAREKRRCRVKEKKNIYRCSETSKGEKKGEATRQRKGEKEHMRGKQNEQRRKGEMRKDSERERREMRTV